MEAVEERLSPANESMTDAASLAADGETIVHLSPDWDSSNTS
jgi:hypothetical protein